MPVWGGLAGLGVGVVVWGRVGDEGAVASVGHDGFGDEDLN